jgi:hypothetical protein
MGKLPCLVNITNRAGAVMVHLVTGPALLSPACQLPGAPLPVDGDYRKFAI